MRSPPPISISRSQPSRTCVCIGSILIVSKTSRSIRGGSSLGLDQRCSQRSTSCRASSQFHVTQNTTSARGRTLLVVVARDDDTSIGILQSRIHEVWALRSGSALEDRPRYTHTTCFETFPFPEGLTPNIPAAAYASDKRAQAIATAAKELFKLRDHYLNPPDWTDWTLTPEEQAAGFPARPVAKPGHEDDLKQRTLTNLYNVSPAWLNLAHEALDEAVADAYGWADFTPQWTDEEILGRLLALNKQRSTKA